jgi:hypothetical protein
MFSKVKVYLPYIIGLIIFSCIFFYPELQGKKLGTHDSVSWYGAAKELLIYQEKGEDIKWTNRVFSGMPLYSIGGNYYGNFLMNVYYKSLEVFPAQIINLFIILSSLFFSLLLLRVEKRNALFLSLAFGVNTWIVDSLLASHSTKIIALAFLALVFSGLISFVRNKDNKGWIALTLGLLMAIGFNHVQIVYYGAIASAIMGVSLFVLALKEKILPDFLKRISIVLIGVCIAVLCNFSTLWVLKDYSKDTMRGGKTELVKNEANSTSKEGGLDINYAFSWSYTPKELFNFLVPDAMGGSSNYKVNSSKSKLAQAINREQVPMYWGEQPFTGAPNYIGAVLFFLALFSFLYWDNKLKYVFGVIFLIFGIMGLGKNFLEINELLFNYLPFYNKFRTPTMAFSMINIGVILMVGMAFQNFLNNNEDWDNKFKALKKTGYTLIGVIILGFLVISNAGYTSLQDNEMFQGSKEMLDLAIEDRQSFFKADLFRTLILFIITGGLFYFYIKKSIDKNKFSLAIGALLFIELWNVSNRYYDKDNFQKIDKIENLVPNESFNQYLQGDTSYYRIINTTTNVFNDNTDGYRYSNVGGYSPAKLYRYQDLIDVHLSKMNMPVLNMLNTKYFIVESNGQKLPQTNPDACGNSWFVNEVKFAKNANEEIDSIGTFNPKTTAWVDIRYKNDSKFDGNTDPNGSILLTKYHPENMEYQSNSTTGGFAVFSEIWYRGNEDWNIYIDGKKETMIRTNYLLRGLYIPAGKHKIEMKFTADKLDFYKKMSQFATLILCILVFVILFKEYKTKGN